MYSCNVNDASSADSEKDSYEKLKKVFLKKNKKVLKNLKLTALCALASCSI
jgi:hypothetical protein